MFGDSDALIQIDMSEYMEKHNVSRLIGAPPGYVGYEEGGQLTEKIRRRPYAVVLLDEIEKAHPDVYNTLLQIMEEGRLTDSFGRNVDFKNTIIIMTTNAGAEVTSYTNIFGFDRGRDEAGSYEQMKERLKVAIEKYFRPEFLNRLDDVIVFHALNKEDLKRIVDIELAKIRGRMSDRGLELVLTDEAKDFLIIKGYNPDYGARPLRRAIENLIENPLSRRDPAELVQGQGPGQRRRSTATPRPGSSSSSRPPSKSTRKQALVAVGSEKDRRRRTARTTDRRDQVASSMTDRAKPGASGIDAVSSPASDVHGRAPSRVRQLGRRRQLAARRDRTRDAAARLDSLDQDHERGDQDRPDQERVEQDAEAESEAQLAQRGQAAGEHRAERPGHDQAARADDAAGVGHGPPRALDRAVHSLFLDHPGHQEDVVVLADGDQDHEQEEADRPVEAAPGLGPAVQRVEDQVGQPSEAR